MTKRELLEDDLFKAMPDDTEIVFNTSPSIDGCLPLKFNDLTYRSDIVAWCERNRGMDAPEPVFRKAIVINARPISYAY